MGNMFISPGISHGIGLTNGLPDTVGRLFRPARWANCMGLLVSQVLAAMGPPFFGFLFDITGGYGLSFAIFGAVLIISALLSLMLKPPRKMNRSDGVLE
jgi:cyanate permease